MKKLTLKFEVLDNAHYRKLDYRMNKTQVQSNFIKHFIWAFSSNGYNCFKILCVSHLIWN